MSQYSFLLINLAFLILDRLTKWIILKNQNFYLGKFLEFKLSKNQGLFLPSFNQPLLFFLIGIILLGLFALLLKTWSKKDYLLTNGVFLIFLGGLSNFYDRLVFGHVIDWINIFFLPFFAFNLADLMITAGVLCLVVNVFNKK